MKVANSLIQQELIYATYEGEFPLEAKDEVLTRATTMTDATEEAAECQC